MGGLEEHGLVWVGPCLDGKGGQQVGGVGDVSVLSHQVKSESFFVKQNIPGFQAPASLHSGRTP